MSAAFREYKLSRLPSVSEYIDGLAAIAPSISAVQRRLLIEQYAAPEHTATATQLARAAGVGGHQAVNGQYGKLGRKFCDEIGFEPNGKEIGPHFWWATWSSGYSTPEGFLWKMLLQVAEALEILGWVTLQDSRITEEVQDQDILTEGAVRQVTVNAYERNAVARKKCIEHYGTSCVICRFDFGAVYGASAEGFIHVHHLKPLSEIGSQYQVNPVSDLRPVCPNCHAMIHLNGATRSIEDVARLLR